MSKTKDWWRAALGSVSATYRHHRDSDASVQWGGFRPLVCLTLDREPGRVVYLELSVGQAKRLREYLDRAIVQAEGENARGGIRPDPLDAWLDSDYEA